MMKRMVCLTTFALLAAVHLYGQPSIVATFIARSHTYKGTTLPYRLFIPSPYDSLQLYPVVLALHGSGERGSDNLVQISNYRLATSWADPVNQAKYPCFVVAPQCPLNGSWTSDILATANDILDSLAREFSIDTNRRYITGLSMGGYGTWEALARFPGRFAAAVPMSGGGDPGSVSNFRDMPIWDFHGTLDPTVPVQQSRDMINALHNLGRSVVYTQCHNADCSGLPDSVVAMDVASHQDLFYTEYQNGGHVIWDQSYDNPYLFPWVFDHYRKIPGAITLTNLQPHRVLSGTETITWSTLSPGDSVEIWFSPDAGDSWQCVSPSEPNTGAYDWNTGDAVDCSFGQIRIFLKNTGGHIYGVSQSGYFTINNLATGTPFVKIIDDEFTLGSAFTSDSLDIPLMIGDSKNSTIPAAIMYSADGGKTYVQADAFTARTDSLVQSRRIGIASLANSYNAVLKALVIDDTLVASSVTSPFPKLSMREHGPTPDHIQGTGGATLSVDVVDAAALTGHRYRVTFDDTSSVQKTYDVLDISRGVKVVQQATELDGVTEGPLFDGLRLTIKDIPQAVVLADSTRWSDGHTTMHATVSVVNRLDGSTRIMGFPAPFDYTITLGSSVIDTSLAGFGFDASPIKFSVWNLTKNRKTDVLFYDSDGDQTISSFDEVDLLDADTSGQLKPSWGIFFVAMAGDTLPLPGSIFQVKTLKPLTTADIYEFNAALNSVAYVPAPSHFSLDQNYPNPFNPTTTISFSLPAARPVTLKIYDILGQEVATLIQEVLVSGRHVVRWNASGLASGVYFYRLQAGEFTQTKRLLLLK
jgi:poly(3-hydroxybutyrate) depolymerase